MAETVAVEVSFSFCFGDGDGFIDRQSLSHAFRDTYMYGFVYFPKFTDFLTSFGTAWISSRSNFLFFPVICKKY